MQFWASFYEELQAGGIIINLYDPKPQHSSTTPWRFRRRLLSSARWLLRLRGCARSDCSSAQAARASSRKHSEGAFSELPGRGAEHRAQLFLPDFWLLSNVFVSKSNRSTSDVAPCTMNFALKHRWATSKAQQHSERLFPGKLPYQGGPINLGHTAHQGTHQLTPSCRHMGQAGMLKTSPTLLSESASWFRLCRGVCASFTCRMMYKLNRKLFK